MGLMLVKIPPQQFTGCGRNWTLATVEDIMKLTSLCPDVNGCFASSLTSMGSTIQVKASVKTGLP